MGSNLSDSMAKPRYEPRSSSHFIDDSIVREILGVSQHSVFLHIGRHRTIVTHARPRTVGG